MSSPEIVILFGGTSDERRVSVATAQNVARAIGQTGLTFMSPEGRMHECTRERLFGHSRPFELDFDPGSPVSRGSLAEALDAGDGEGRVYFLALHGGEGEDGGIQRLFEDHGVAFTGSGSDASRLAFDKRLAKKAARSAGLKIAPRRGDRRRSGAGAPRNHEDVPRAP